MPAEGEEHRRIAVLDGRIEPYDTDRLGMSTRGPHESCPDPGGVLGVQHDQTATRPPTDVRGVVGRQTNSADDSTIPGDRDQNDGSGVIVDVVAVRRVEQSLAFDELAMA
ncbi:hypothetical protein GOOTI_070_00030 [Gordonia otitidis NBRC 100426]|uniref:Uncharacterized protein n=1 Tax=Gordonia otitidis (strain DSM 44809 / CCUG 52243 / JCM 12355 / NBRC 100426 / IFM 10032) TaxID=1108044 RepID=H5TJA8_GORO1|nr:hypothetical protein GOOTI_070_00030 [Gordonia otitidis NBRC 100426]